MPISVSDLPPKYQQQVLQKLKAMPEQKRAPAANKYHAEKTEKRGITFDSKLEARRYEELLLYLDYGSIKDLRLQEDFTLQEAYTTAAGERIRAIRYKADFTYTIAAPLPPLGCSTADYEFWAHQGPGARIIEDTKTRATRTKVYKIKRKLMADKGYEIREVK